jgi:hypothetical protein
MVVLTLLACTGAETPTPPVAPVAPPIARPAPKLAGPGPIPVVPQPGDPAPALSEQNCHDLTEGGPVGGPDCVTAKIACGQTVIGHTRGGANAGFDTRFYESHFCTPALTNHDSGDERVYELTLPDGDHHATAWLDTPCADLDLAAFRITDPRHCPGPKGAVAQCEMNVQPGTRREKVEFVSNTASTWLLVVEGKDQAEGAFGLTVECGEGLR